MKKLTIAVVIITYNRVNYLRSAVKSVLDQERLPDEIVILDDGSNDNTIEYLEEMKRKLKQLIWKSQKNSGVGVARKEAVKMSTSDIVAVLDSDDVLYPTALSAYIQMFERSPELDIVYGDIAFIDKQGCELSFLRYKNYNNNNDFKRAIFLNPRVPFKHSAVAFRKSRYFEVGGYDENCNIKIDIELMLKFIDKNMKIKHIDEKIAGFRLHDGSISRKRLKGIKKWYYFILRYEKNNINRFLFMAFRTSWELGKSVVEILRYIMETVFHVQVWVRR